MSDNTETIQRLQDNVTHYQYILSTHSTPEIDSAFNQLLPSEYTQWTMDAIAAKKAAGSTPSAIHEYIAKVTHVHLYEAQKELAALQ